MTNKKNFNFFVEDNNSKNNNKNMDKRFLRVCLCNCNTGRFITSMSKQDIDYIYQAVIKSSSETGDWITDSIKEDSLKILGELKRYLFGEEDQDLDQEKEEEGG